MPAARDWRRHGPPSLQRKRADSTRPAACPLLTPSKLRPETENSSARIVLHPNDVAFQCPCFRLQKDLGGVRPARSPEKSMQDRSIVQCPRQFRSATRVHSVGRPLTVQRSGGLIVMSTAPDCHVAFDAGDRPAAANGALHRNTSRTWEMKGASYASASRGDWRGHGIFSSKPCVSGQ